ncbi:hypothetical protein SAMN05444673_3266 [Bacillus sp. OV166]|uniref:hypothetical protein n=1 Tax=Bacillus sp. OV166 TaxID=1882763 RepID=UPI000A2ADF87|nr:hypothetical protein [Bacillus sp. OV166]SMQ78150.1 hypothetical protein SAMN05444673_3266 [Bacillus sp. OV166]
MGMTYEECKKVLRNMEERLNYHKILAWYIKQTVKLKKHQDDIKYWEEAIQQAKEDFGYVYDNI